MMFRFPCRAALYAGLSLTVLSTASASVAQPTAKPAPTLPSTVSVTGYDIKGFRSANFGMTQAQAKAAIAADFGAGAKTTDNANIVEGTQALQVSLDHLDPGPGPALVTYIFGATSHTLTHINVVWVVPGEPTAEQRAAIVTAAVQLTNYFQNLPNPLKATAGVTPTGPNGLLMFAGVDKKGAGIEVATDGISYQATKKEDNKETTSPPPKGPAVLRVSYIANAANPDILKIKPGAF
ncbi:MAG TPA: hypothetical protein VNX61_10220 [Rhizomicrobium sp.]|nr:hypothetical protein [Rhizomicrobium sp.]